MLPNWVNQNNTKTCGKNNVLYIKKTLSSITSLIKRYKVNANTSAGKVDAFMKVVYCLATITLISISRNAYFLFIETAVIFIHMSLCDKNIIKDILVTTVSTLIFVAIMLSPVILFGNGKSFILILTKVFISINSLRLLSDTTIWGDITSFLAVIYVPDVVILIIDITLNFIKCLGIICENILTILTVRIIGDTGNAVGFGSVIGKLFTASNRFSDEVYMAMQCRCYNGKYIKRITYDHLISDCLLFGFVILLTTIDAYLNNVV